MRWTTYSGSKGSEKRRASLMLICRPDQSPLHILNEKLSADPARVVLRPFHLAWASNVPEPSRAAQLVADRSEEHTSELQSLMRSSYAVFCYKKKKKIKSQINHIIQYTL